MTEAEISPATNVPLLRPLKVLHVGPGFGQRGGVASVLGELAASAVLFGDEGISFSFFETRGFKRPINLLLFGLVDIPRFVIAMCQKVDAVHFHVSADGSFYRKFVLYLIARSRGKRTLFHWHANNLKAFRSSAGWMVARAVTNFVRGSDAAIGVSREMSQDLEDERGTRDRIYTIGNSAYAAETATKDGEKTARSDCLPYLAFAARFVPEKGIADLFAAIALLKGEGCFARLKLAGTGDIRPWEQMIENLQISDRVTFVGWLSGEEKLQFYRDARAFCLPSYREPFGIVTLEAMFCGVAVIGTNRGGFLDLVEEGVTGYLVAPRDPKALAGSIRSLIESPESARQMGLAGRDRARRLYSTEAIVGQYVQCYRDVAMKRTGRQ
ncbi:glycosyltransferase family 4 protein [Caballeronia sp. dw_19]|uniref:glycosyltransferase family 4 protein n=1 Tax=Caballeronia sp. dw_19 TaxID=2719791 RepID=UPI001BD22FC7|nr:glycosyltransferase family 4 protein [Caballeronia sp. dw_19]